MDIFGRKKKTVTLTDLMVDYINSMLPKGVHCRETITDKKSNAVLVFSDTKALSFEFDIDGDYDIKELSVGDKTNLDQTVVIPALKMIDQELFQIHKAIETRLKELDGS